MKEYLSLRHNASLNFQNFHIAFILLVNFKYLSKWAQYSLLSCYYEVPICFLTTLAVYLEFGVTCLLSRKKDKNFPS